MTSKSLTGAEENVSHLALQWGTTVWEANFYQQYKYNNVKWISTSIYNMENMQKIRKVIVLKHLTQIKDFERKIDKKTECKIFNNKTCIWLQSRKMSNLSSLLDYTGFQLIIPCIVIFLHFPIEIEYVGPAAALISSTAHNVAYLHFHFSSRKHGVIWTAGLKWKLRYAFKSEMRRL